MECQGHQQARKRSSPRLRALAFEKPNLTPASITAYARENFVYIYISRHVCLTTRVSPFKILSYARVNKNASATAHEISMLNGCYEYAPKVDAHSRCSDTPYSTALWSGSALGMGQPELIDRCIICGGFRRVHVSLCRREYRQSPACYQKRQASPLPGHWFRAWRDV